MTSSLLSAVDPLATQQPVDPTAISDVSSDMAVFSPRTPSRTLGCCIDQGKSILPFHSHTLSEGIPLRKEKDQSVLLPLSGESRVVRRNRDCDRSFG